ncbi:thiamine pyrophosphate-dependent enzyme [Micromonospora sp. R77]|nr:thiamine pyrophosphate-binding protein [Micromonospora sp. R77]MCI4065599.1 thiamine pyrophosphate-dependent enzyme [Micromonospora sp. R77]
MSNGSPRVADHIMSALAATGVSHVFGVGGANIEDLYDAAHRTDGRIRAVVAKHEFAAACMAEGSVRAAGGLGVVMATSGAGAMNLVPGVAEAYAARVPLLALVGQPPRDLEGRGAFQDSSGRGGAFDATELFGTISRFCARVDDPADTGKLLAAAIDAARSPRGGPAVLLLPKDVQQATVASFAPVDLLPTSASGPAPGRRAAADLLARPSPTGRDPRRRRGRGRPRRRPRRAGRAGRAAGRLGRGDPGGQGRLPQRRPPVRRGDRCDRPPQRRAPAHRRRPLRAGGHPAAGDGPAGLDAALATVPLIGFDPEPPFVAPAGGVPLVHVDGDLRAELRAAVELLADAPPARPVRRDPAGHREFLVTPTLDTPGVRLPDAVRAIGDAVPADATVVSDAGNASAAAVHHLPVPPQGRFVIALGMGGMGHSFGAGIGAAFATGRRSYVLSGDGGFYAHGMELHTAVEYDVPVTFVVFNNNAHAMCVTREQLLQHADYSYNTFKPAQLAAGAAAMFPSLPAVRADTADELREALLATNDRPGPALVCVETDPGETPPFVPFLRLIGDPTIRPGGNRAEHVPPVG